MWQLQYSQAMYLGTSVPTGLALRRAWRTSYCDLSNLKSLYNICFGARVSQPRLEHFCLPKESSEVRCRLVYVILRSMVENVLRGNGSNEPLRKRREVRLDI